MVLKAPPPSAVKYPRHFVARCLAIADPSLQGGAYQLEIASTISKRALTIFNL